MLTPAHAPATPEPEVSPQASRLHPEVVAQLRHLAHDLSNSVETVMQASYLLSQAKLDDTNRRWVELIDQATKGAARINRKIRDLLRAQSVPR